MCAQGQIAHVNGSTHNYFAKSSGISAGPYIKLPVRHTTLISLPYDVNLFILQRFIKGCCYLVPLRHGMAVEHLALRGVVEGLKKISG
jgi:hypothetical protein